MNLEDFDIGLEVRLDRLLVGTYFICNPKEKQWPKDRIYEVISHSTNNNKRITDLHYVFQGDIKNFTMFHWRMVRPITYKLDALEELIRLTSI